MTQEEKDLLLKDLCARLPYEIKCAIYSVSGTIMKDKETIFHTPWPNIITFEGYERNECYMYWQVKPYLRSMSSMTEEEKLKYITLTHYNTDDEGNPYRELTVEAIDWLNENHFDYRGLIPMGLALEAPEGMYK